jgi:hypothetical protein
VRFAQLMSVEPRRTLMPPTTTRAYSPRLMQATSVPFFSNASITGTNPSPNKRLHWLSVSLTDRMDAA